MEREGQKKEYEPSFNKLRLKNFSNMMDISDMEDSIWIKKKGNFEGKTYLVRISNREISSYIF
jgi:hypothetical protein